MGRESHATEFDMTPEMRVSVRREHNAERINAILNHPEVRPWVADGDGPLDVTPQVKIPGTILLVGQFGACIFYNIMPGVFEVHSQCLPEGRGKWMAAFVKSVLQWMFIKSNCWEVVTRVPHGHVAAKALTLGAAFQREFTRDDQCVFRGKQVPVDIYRLSIHDWIENSVWAEESGSKFHDQLHAEAKRLGITTPAHEDDPQHNRVAGATVEMARNGQVVKAFMVYSRWAYLARHEPIFLLSEEPPIFKMDIGNMKILPHGIRIAP